MGPFIFSTSISAGSIIDISSVIIGLKISRSSICLELVINFQKKEKPMSHLRKGRSLPLNVHDDLLIKLGPSGIPCHLTLLGTNAIAPLISLRMDATNKAASPPVEKPKITILLVSMNCFSLAQLIELKK
jgi:hypothetical protein